MPAPHYVLTLTGGVDRLSDALGAGFTAPAGARDERARSITLQANGANSNIIYIGGDGAVTSSNYGSRIEVPASTIPSAPMVIELGERGVRPSDIYVKGTASEKLHFQLFGTA